MRKVCVVITARPSYSRIKTALIHLRASGVDLRIVTSASANLERYGRVHDIIARDLFTIDTISHNVVEGDLPSCMVQTTGLSMLHLSQVFERMKPDVVVTIADRYETLATAAAASYMNIPLCHIQGGEMTGSIDDKVRNAVTQLADIHCVSTYHSAKRVHRMLDPYESTEWADLSIHQTGCPSIDLAKYATREGGDYRPALDRLVNDRGRGATINLYSPYVVVLMHPVTAQHDIAYAQTKTLIRALEAECRQVIWFWPNVDAGSDGTSKALRESAGIYNTRFLRNLDPDSFIRLAYHSSCIVGNSSFGIREAGFLGIPAVNIGTRQQGRERAGNVVDVHDSASEIKTAVREAMKIGRHPSSALYGDGKAGERIADVLSTLERK